MTNRWGEWNWERGVTAVPNSLFKHAGELDLRPLHLAVIGYIASMDFGGVRPFPSIAEMASDLGLSPQTVRGGIEHLESLGYLTVIPRSDRWGQRSNAYDLDNLADLLEAVTDPDLHQDTVAAIRAEHAYYGEKMRAERVPA